MSDMQVHATNAICSQLLDNAVSLIDKKFESEYARKNPHLLSVVLETQERIYNSLANTTPNTP